jgi:hypothetical protein
MQDFSVSVIINELILLGTAAQYLEPFSRCRVMVRRRLQNQAPPKRVEGAGICYGPSLALLNSTSALYMACRGICLGRTNDQAIYISSCPLRD